VIEPGIRQWTARATVISQHCKIGSRVLAPRGRVEICHFSMLSAMAYISG